MRLRTWLVPLLGLCFVTPTLANGLYRWIDASGHVAYGDAPTPGARQVQPLRASSGTALDTGKAPSLDSVRAAQAPAATVLPPDVTLALFITDCGEVCQLAKSFMNERGLPYREIDPRADDASREAFLKASPSSVVPTLQIQKANGEVTSVSGYNSNQWYESLKKVGVSFPAPGKMVMPGGASNSVGASSPGLLVPGMSAGVAPAPTSR